MGRGGLGGSSGSGLARVGLSQSAVIHWGWSGWVESIGISRISGSSQPGAVRDE